jgi:hypothetical protein
MDDADRKLLTEYLGECWHEPGDRVSKESPVIQCAKCKKYYHPMSGFHTFTTLTNMMDLYEAIVKKGKWWEFVDYAGNQDTEHSVTEFETTFQIFASIASWLFCLNGQGYEERCQMVADWIKEASHE